MSGSIEEFLGKKYKLKSSENFDEYMKFIGIGLFSRKAAGAVSPVSCLVLNPDGSYTLTLSTAIRDVSSTFRLGEEFVEERADGVKVKSVMVLEGNKLIQTQTEDSGRISRHIREFTPKQLIVKSTAEGWNDTCTRIYELVE